MYKGEQDNFKMNNESNMLNKRDTPETEIPTDIQNVNLNGMLTIEKSLIPEELLIYIFSFVDYQQLIVCHLVCKQWNTLIKNYVWKKKAESVTGQKFPIDANLTWISYYFVCIKRPFNRNLLLSNHVLLESSKDFVPIDIDTNPPLNILPFPEDSGIKGRTNWVTLRNEHEYCTLRRRFTIDLLKEGCTEELLDCLQPIVKVSEWYCCSSENDKANYECSIKLLEARDDDYGTKVIRAHHVCIYLKHAHQRGHWLKSSSEFKNYDRGLRVIKFYDGGKNEIIMGGACIELTIPAHQNVNKKEL